MLTCQDVEQRGDALIDGTPLTFGERLTLRGHLVICRHCRRYLRQLDRLTAHLRAESPAPLDDDQARLIAQQALDPPSSPSLS